MHREFTVAKLPITIARFQNDDMKTICSWVLTQHQLRMISEECNSQLHPDLLAEWCSDSVAPMTILYNGKPVGFCALSDQEHDYPRGHIELCHFIISPQFRRRYLGTTLTHYIRLLAADMGYKTLHGRVVPSNNAALSFTRYGHWRTDRSDFLNPDFEWFKYELRTLCNKVSRKATADFR